MYITGSCGSVSALCSAAVHPGWSGTATRGHLVHRSSPEATQYEHRYTRRSLADMIITRDKWLFYLMVFPGLLASKASGENSQGAKNLSEASPTLWDGSSTGIPEPVPYWFQVYNLLDPAQALLFFGAQAGPANLNETFPITFLPLINPFDGKYVLKRCARADVSKCMSYGGPSTGRPARLQGVFWQDGIAWPDELISPPPAPWDSAVRKMSVFPWGTKSWGYYDTNPQKDKTGLVFLPSGASFYNGAIYLGARYDIYFNKDITLGQIIWVQRLFGFEIPIPTWLFNWTMEYQSEGTWKRTSTLLFNLINSATGSYTLRQIVDGSGKPTASFSAWVKARNGRPFYYPQKVT